MALSNRAMLQAVANPLCSFNGTNCGANVLLNIPDTDTIEFFVKAAVCLNITDEILCGENQFCIWSDGECAADTLVEAQACFDPDFVVLRRTVDCEFFLSEAKCTSLGGCEWSAGGACQVSQTDVVQAINNDQALLAVFQKDADCQAASPCSGECQLIDGECVYPGIDDITQWITGTSPFCNFMRQNIVCLQASVDACPAECEVVPPDFCALAVASEPFIDITYADNPTLGEQMKAAIVECPSITTADECSAFSP